MLRDPVKRQAYDQHLASKQNLAEISISDVVVAREMDEAEYEGEICLEYDCRCGGVYVVAKADVETSHALVQCSICSLVIEVQTADW